MFLAFICANNIGSSSFLVICLELNPGPVFFFSLSGGFNFTLSAIFSCDGNRIDQGDDDDPGLHFRFVGVFCLSLSI